MPAMRITSAYMTRHWLDSVRNVQSGVASLNEQISSGRKIHRPSDDPTVAVKSLAVTDQLERYEQFQRNIDFAGGFVDTAETSLADVTSVLQRIRELVVQAGNDTNDQGALDAIAAEISQLKESVRQSANTRYGDDYIFSGTATTTSPYPPPGNAYAGNGEPIARRIDDGTTVQINRDGPTVFGTTTGPAPTQMDMFDLIDQIVSDLQGGSAAERNQLRGGDLEALDQHLGNVLQERAELGAMRNRLDSAAGKFELLEARATEELSKLQDTDIAEAAMKLTNLNTVYESALMTGSRMLQTSLVDFL